MTADHRHACLICGTGSPWYGRYRWTLFYIAVVVTLLLASALMELLVW